MPGGLVWPLVVEDRASTVLSRFAASADSGATAADRLTDAVAATSDAMATMSRSELDTRAAQLQFTSAAARAAKAATDESTSIERLAATQAAALRAQSRLAAVSDPYAKMRESAEKMTSVGESMSKAITLPVAAFAAYGVDEAVKFQKGMATIQVTSGETAAKMAQLKTGVVSMAKDTGTSFSQLEQGLYTVAKAGAQKWSATQQLQVLRAGAQGARIEAVDLGTSMSALTSVMQGYGLHANQAVQAENEIIRASGLSKTTMSEFAGSLSNVIPLASALHISFAQVGGAIATMTQHGESAQRATENLNNLIRNLAGSNNVAVQAMGQLGLRSQVVAETLSKQGPGGGLSGALNLVESAMARQGHAGLVVISAFKEAQNATADLSTALGRMPANLRSVSSAFASGKLGYKDYYQDVKALGGQQYVMGKQFIGLVQQADGFSNALKSGNPQVQTMAQAFKTLLGGSTGMNAALMLSGNSAKTFASNVGQIGAVAASTGKDVDGWATIQHTSSQQFAEDLQKLNAAALTLGNQLLPTLTTLADDAANVVTSFENMSGTQKDIAEWGIGVLAAIGPVMTLGGKLISLGTGIGKTTTTIGNGLAKLGGSATGMSDTMTTAMGRASAAVAGAGIGAAIGEITQNSGTATKAVGGLGAVAAGALVGFGAGGPIGAAIGGGAALVGDLATSFFNSGQAAQKASLLAKAALLEQKTAASDLLGVLQQVNGAYSGQYKAQLISELSSKGLLAAADKVHVAPQTVVQAAMGNQGAITQFYSALSSSGMSSSQFDKLTSSFNAISRGAGAAERAYELQREAAGKLGASIDPLNNSLSGLSRDFLTTGESARTAATQYGVTGEQTTAIGIKTTGIIRDHVLALTAESQVEFAHGATLRSVTSSYTTQIAVLQRNLTQLGFNRTAVDKLVASYQKTPAQLVTEMIAKTSDAKSNVSVLQNDIDAVRQNKIPGLTANSTAADAVISALTAKIDAIRQSHVPSLSVSSASALASIQAVESAIAGVQNKTVAIHVATYNSSAGGGATTYEGISTTHKVKRAMGGAIVGRGTKTSDSIVAMVSNGEHVWTADEVTGAGGHGAVEGLRAAALNRQLPKYAQGGPIYRVRHGYGYAGDFYSTMKAARAGRADALNTNAAAVPDADTNWRTSVASGDIASIRSSYATLLADAQAAGASRNALNALSVSERRIITDLQARARVTAQVTTAQSYLTDLQSKAADASSSVASAFTGSFDITSAGAATQTFNDQAAAPTTAGSILAAVTAAASKATAYKGLLGKLLREGLNSTLVQQLAAAGPGAYDQAAALAAATPAQLSGINSQYKILGSAGTSAGSAVASALYGTQISAAQALLNGYSTSKNPHMAAAVRALATQLFGAGKVSGVGLEHGLLGQQKAAGNAAAALGRQVEASLRKSLGIASPSRVTRELGRHTGTGFALGLLDTVATVTAASGALASAGAPSPGAPTSGSYTHNETHHHHEWNITEADNGMEVHHQVMRRLALSGP